MKLSEFINVFMFAAMCGKCDSSKSFKNLSSTYQKYFEYIPKIVCKDGFKISIQVHNGNYCASENGIRTFGINWEEVEWGFPNRPIDPIKYNAECAPTKQDTTSTVGGYVDISIMEDLINGHGGIDLEKTLTEYMEREGVNFTE